MQFRDYFLSMSQRDRERYAKRAGTTAYYIQTHLIARPPRKIPKPKLMRSLAKASRGKVSFDEIIEHFYSKSAA